MTAIPQRGFSDVSPQDVEDSRRKVQQATTNAEYDFNGLTATRLEMQTRQAKQQARVDLINSVKEQAEKIRM